MTGARGGKMIRSNILEEYHKYEIAKLKHYIAFHENALKELKQ